MFFLSALTLVVLTTDLATLSAASLPLGQAVYRSPHVQTAQAGGATDLAQSNDTPSIANPSVGIGLSGIADYATQQPFLNLMKTARPWIGHVGTAWGGMDLTEMRELGYLDDFGWPIAVPPGVTGISTLVLTDLPKEAISTNGRYRLTYEGQGAIEISSMGETVEGHNGEAWFTAEAGVGSMVIITIRRTDPNGTGDYLRNFTIVQEQNIPAFEVGRVFNPQWTQEIRDMRNLRFMDWMDTNNSAESEWDTRPQVDEFSYASHGVPLEVMIQLANEVHTDPWFNIPHMATDEYIRNFATMVRDGLDPQLRAHVELSNEVWNWQFSQSTWAEQQGLERWGQDGKWVQFYALRASEMAVIWDDVFGLDADTRLVKIISTQTGWLGLEEDILTAPLWVAESPENAPPYSYFDAYAVTGYFSAGLGDTKATTVLGWLEDSREKAEENALNLADSARADYVESHMYDLAIQLAFEELSSGAITGDHSGSVQGLVDVEFPYHAAVAKKYGLDLVMYEGGTHVVGIGDWVENEALTEFFSVLNYSEEMGVLYGQLLEGWRTAGGGLFSMFVDVAPPSKWGSWGALRFLGDSNPRWDAIRGFNTDHSGWWETRSAGTFD